MDGTGCAGVRGHARSHQTKCNPLFFKHSGSHQLVPQFPGFAKQSPDLSVLAPGFEFLKTFFDISLFLG
ncbi:hypothetical protein N436_05494 [Pseudomonas sp. RV120224-01b]|nr:hypothetical protein N428_05469 [Pseudomonas sp. RV120224-01c]PYG76415.1 hypothetical protein N436_05494 [Pseudomonas sp. RV120224-01b]